MESPFSRGAGCSPVAVLRNLLLSQLGVLRAALKCLTALSLSPAPCHQVSSCSCQSRQGEGLCSLTHPLFIQSLCMPRAGPLALTSF